MPEIHKFPGVGTDRYERARWLQSAFPGVGALLPDEVDILSAQHEVLALADVVVANLADGSKDERLVELDRQVFEKAAVDLQEGLGMISPGALGVVAGAGIRRYSRHERLMPEYGREPINGFDRLVVPAERITAVQVLTQVLAAECKPELKVRIRTETDPLISRMENQAIVATPNPGLWYNFPLSAVRLAMLGQNYRPRE